MNKRDNFIRFLKNESYDRPPAGFDLQEFQPEEIPDNIARGLVLQQKPYTGRFGGKDLFGVEWYYDESAGGSMETGVLFEDIEDWKKHVIFPDLDTIDWKGIAERNYEYLHTDRVNYSMIYTGYFERLISFVGFENAAIALIDEDQLESVKELFDKLTDLYIDYVQRMHRYFNIEIVELHDDWGNQRGLMFSEKTWIEMIAPYIKRLADAAHTEGVFIEQHSCGKIGQLIPELIKTGVDTWRGQPGINVKKSLVNTFGDVFKFGVWVRPDDKLDDDDAIKFFAKIYNEYKGKRVWYALDFVFTEPQVGKIKHFLETQGV